MRRFLVALQIVGSIGWVVHALTIAPFAYNELGLLQAVMATSAPVGVVLLIWRNS